MRNVQWAARKMSASKSARWLSAGKAGAEAVMGPLSQQLSSSYWQQLLLSRQPAALSTVTFPTFLQNKAGSTLLLHSTSHSLPRHCQSWAPKQAEVLWTPPQSSLPSRHWAHIQRSHVTGENFNSGIVRYCGCLNLEEQLLVGAPCPTHSSSSEAMPRLFINLAIVGATMNYK